MEASSASNGNSIVPGVLENSNYKIWSSCMEDYLVGQDLWDVVSEPHEPEAISNEEGIVDASKNIIKTFRKKNALALHAIKMSCGPYYLSQLADFKSANHAWNFLAAAGSVNTDDEESEINTESYTTDNTGDWSSMEPSEFQLQLFKVPSLSDGVAEIIDFVPYIKAVMEGDKRIMKVFVDYHPQVLSAKLFYKGRTTIHYALREGQIAIAEWLIEEMRAEDLEIQDEYGKTSLAVGASYNYPDLLPLLKLMVKKNPNLPNIGTLHNIPVLVSAYKDFKDTTRFLYHVTDLSDFNSEHNINIAVTLLIHCINIKLFDIATVLVKRFPTILLRHNNHGIYPIRALASTFSAFWNRIGSKNSNAKLSKVSNDKVLEEARAFLQLVCSEVSTFDIKKLVRAVYGAMIEATKNGCVEFVNKMLQANPMLIWACYDDKSMIWYAIEYRQEKIYNLIYGVPEQKDALLSRVRKDGNNILHSAATLAPSSIVKRTSGAALQMQRELQWFEEVCSMAKPRYQDDLNSAGLTPRQLFTISHEKLVEAGEKAMKDTAQSCTVVGALITTIMFAAVFTVPGGNNQDTGLPVFSRKVMFKIFVICDALSLYSSTTSVLVFLEILTSRFTENDFLLKLPRKQMIGLSTLFLSITTMMVTFCAALTIMLDGQLQLILPVVLVASVPIVFFLSSITPLLYEIFMSTFGPSIFDRNTKLPDKKEENDLSISLSFNMEEDFIMPASVGADDFY